VKDFEKEEVLKEAAARLQKEIVSIRKNFPSRLNTYAEAVYQCIKPIWDAIINKEFPNRCMLPNNDELIEDFVERNWKDLCDIRDEIFQTIETRVFDRLRQSRSRPL